MEKTGNVDRIPLAEAVRIVRARVRPVVAETVAVEESLGRVTAASVHARFASPHYRASAMDGIAVVAAATQAAADSRALILAKVAVVATPSGDAPACVPVDTGSPLPDWADAVVRIENTRAVDGGYEIRAPVSPGRDVRTIGEDTPAGALLLGRGRTIRPYDVGAMLATGVDQVSVRKRPSVGVIATGREVIEPVTAGHTPRAGQVIEFNSRVLAGFATEWGAHPVYLGRADDEREKLAAVIRRAAADHDVVCVIAGSSAGRKDLTIDVLGSLGELLFHGVGVMPGKPAAFAVIDETPVLAIPGYPVSAVVVYRELLRPLLDAALDHAPRNAPQLVAQVRRRLPSRLGVEELVRVCLTADGDSLVVAPLPRGAGSISTLVRAHGWLRIAPTSEGYDAGSEVVVELLDHDCDPFAATVVGGAPDALSALLEDSVASKARPARFSHLSLAEHDALHAVAIGEAHLAVLGETAAAEPMPGELTSSARPIVLSDPHQRPRGAIVVRSTYASSPAGIPVVDTIESPAFLEAAARLLGVTRLDVVG